MGDCLVLDDIPRAGSEVGQTPLILPSTSVVYSIVLETTLPIWRLNK